MAERSSAVESARRTAVSGYADVFRECGSVLDVGAASEAFLDLLRERGISRLVHADDAAGLNALAERFDGVHVANIVETLADGELTECLRACAARLEPGGVVLVRTANGSRPLAALRNALAAARLRVTSSGHELGDERSLYLLARAPGASSARSPRVAVAFQGAFFTQGSLAVVNRELARALLAHPDVAPAIVPDEASPDAMIADDPRYAALRAATRNSIPPFDVLIRQSAGFRIDAAPVQIQILPWEYGALPLAWADGIRSSADAIWTPSAYCRTMFLAADIAPERVTVVPNGIDPAVFSPDRALEPYPLATRKSFRFLYVGSPFPRKGLDVLLEGFRRAFRAADDVALVLKLTLTPGTQTLFANDNTTRFAGGGAAVRAFADDRDAPEVVIVADDLPGDDVVRLYRSCDAFACPYRGEGFGMPMLEALACGLPVIATAGGAADEFLGDDAYLVPARRAVPPASAYGGWQLAGAGWWLEPDVDSLAAALRRVVDDYGEARKLALRGAQRVRTEWTWARAAQIAAADLRTRRALIAAG